MKPIELINTTFIKNQLGGDFDTYKQILWYLETTKYTEFTGINNDIEYKFEIIQGLPNKHPNYNGLTNSFYLNNGYNATVIAIKCVSHNISSNGNHTLHVKDTRHDHDILVIKILFIKKKDTQDEWNATYYLKNYKKRKDKFGKLLADCYFFGSSITKQPEEYDQDLHENKVRQQELYISNIETSKLVFDIYKYYKNDPIRLPTKIQCLLKFCAVLYYINKLYIYVCDLKYKNISFDENNNTILIDVSENLFKTYYKQYKNTTKWYHILWPVLTFSNFSACYLKKTIFFLLGGDKESIRAQLDTTDFVTAQKKTIEILFSKLNNTRVDYDGYTYYNIDYNFKLDKFNSISVVDIILNLFFESASIEQLLYTENKPFPTELHQINIDLPGMLLEEVAYFDNLNDIDILTRYIEAIKKNDPDIPDAIIQKIKILLFDPITECGLLAPDYENIPSYAMAFKYLMSLDSTLNIDIYQLLDICLKENIGTIDEELTGVKVQSKIPKDYKDELNKGIFVTQSSTADSSLNNIGYDVNSVLKDLKLLGDEFDNITYDQWRFGRLVEQLMDRPEYRTYANLEIPPLNSKLPQLIALDVRKWIKIYSNITNDKYIESDEYLSKLYIYATSTEESKTNLLQYTRKSTPQLALEQIQTTNKTKIANIVKDLLSNILSTGDAVLLAKRIVLQIQITNILTNIEDILMKKLLEEIQLNTQNIDAQIKYITCAYSRLLKSKNIQSEISRPPTYDSTHQIEVIDFQPNINKLVTHNLPHNIPLTVSNKYLVLYKTKYLKYKTKYLELKKQLII